MGSAQVSGFLAACFLLLSLLADSTSACYCQGQELDLKTEFCKSDVVFKGIFLSGTMASPWDFTWARYDFEPTATFKLPTSWIDLRHLHTQVLGTTCAYRHNPPYGVGEYVITGIINGLDVIIDMCNFIKPWNSLSVEQQQALQMLSYFEQCGQ